MERLPKWVISMGLDDDKPLLRQQQCPLGEHESRLRRVLPKAPSHGVRQNSVARIPWRYSRQHSCRGSASARDARCSTSRTACWVSLPRREQVAYLRLAIIASTSTEAATLTLADLWQGTLF